MLFDLDGVITPTAEIHERAWGELFAGYDFTEADYLAYVDGKPRYDGVALVPGRRGVDLPEGDPADPPGDDTVCALGNRKNDAVQRHPRRDGIAPYPGSLALLDLLDDAGVPEAIVSSSKNAVPVLAAAGPRATASRSSSTAWSPPTAGSPASPHPDDTCSAPNGSASTPPGRRRRRRHVRRRRRCRRRFGFVLGVDRGGSHDALLDDGATFVVDDLADAAARPTTRGDGIV